MLDQRAVEDTSLQLRVGSDVSGELTVAGLRLELSQVRSVYIRPYDCQRVAAVVAAGPGSPLWQRATDLDDALLSWCDLTPAMVINRPSAMSSNDSKPYQSRLIAAAGFRTPETLITTDSRLAQAFYAKHGDVVYKSCSSVRSIVRRFDPADQARLEDLRWCPTQFQQRIVGTDYRVHVVGEDVFACRIMAEADDYRYDSDAVVVACKLDSDLAERCKSLSRALDLLVAGLDLRESIAGDWYCFEVNPSPGFTYYQERANQPIDLAIAEMLLAEDRSSTR
jgi:glutathione synthase/RimK-type ligase-like ATP-grasp enzyme